MRGVLLSLRHQLVYFLSFFIIFHPFLPVFAGGVVAEQGSGVRVFNQDGTPVVSIAAPNAQGLSHNKFTDYDVDKSGLVLNNSNLINYNVDSRSAITGRHVEFNTNLIYDTAKVILNEVTSSNPSILRGKTEVYGAKADLIIANPNGITCGGCGFINVDKLTMVTGKPHIRDGEIKEYAISPVGVLKIDGMGEERFGLDTANSAELVSRVVELAGDINVDQGVTVLTGNGVYDPVSGAVSSGASHSPAPILAVDAYALGAMKAGSIKIHASETGLGIRAGGLLASADTLVITADGGIEYHSLEAANKVAVSSGSAIVQRGGDKGGVLSSGSITLEGNRVDLEGGSVAGKALTVKSGGGLNSRTDIYALDASFEAAEDAALKNVYAENTFSVDAVKVILEGGYGSDISVNALAGVELKDTVYAKESIAINAGGDIAFSGNAESKVLKAGGKKITNSGVISASRAELTARDDLSNAGAITLADSGVFKAHSLHNYGRILSKGTLDFDVERDQINYDASGILAAGNITFKTGRNFINYKGEIYSGGDIKFTGRDGFWGSLAGEQRGIITNEEARDAKHNDTLYGIQGGSTVWSFEPNTKEVEEGGELTTEYIHIGGERFEVTEEFFPEVMALGDSFQFGVYTVFFGKEIESETEGERGVAYSLDEGEFYTIKDALGNKVSYQIDLDVAEEGDAPSHPAQDEFLGTAYDGGKAEISYLAVGGGNYFVNGYDYTLPSDVSGSLLNISGRIESAGAMEINTAHLQNIGLDKPLREGAIFDTATRNIKGQAGWEAGWELLGYDYVTFGYLSSDRAFISSSDMRISAGEVYNYSSTISAGGNLNIEAAYLKNITSHVTVETAYYEQERGYAYWTKIPFTSRKMGAGSKKNNRTYYKPTDIYSNQNALILAGGKLSVKAGSVSNDQSESHTGGVPVGSKQIDIAGSAIVLPKGKNGLFTVAAGDGKYVVVGDYRLLDPASYLGGEYFFSKASVADSSVKLLGDPAYETRLVMDQIKDASHSRYLESGGNISSDLEQMRALYDNAVAEGARLELGIGTALTKEQVGALRSDIIWYVEREVNGGKALVPVLYLAEGSFVLGSALSGQSVDILADTLYSSGAITASGDIAIAGGAVVNSGRIDGGTVDIKADKIVNETLVYTNTVESANYTSRTDTAGGTAVISGEKGVSIEAGTFENRGAVIAAKEGDVSIKAEEAIFATVQLVNSERIVSGEGNAFKFVETAESHKTLQNVKGEVSAGGGFLLDVRGDASFAGTVVEAVGDAFLTVGGALTVSAVTDYVEDTLEKKSGTNFGLKGTVDYVRDYAETLLSSTFNVGGRFTSVSGGDTDIIGSKINAGSGADLYAGYVVDGNGDLARSAAGGTVNEFEAYAKKEHNEAHTNWDYTEGLGKALAAMVDPTLAATYLLATKDFKVSFRGGHADISTNIGEKRTEASREESDTAVASSVKTAGGDLHITATGDVNIRGSELNSGGALTVTAERDINITDAHNSTYTETTVSEGSVSVGVRGGNAYADFVFAAIEFWDARVDFLGAYELHSKNLLSDDDTISKNDASIAKKAINLVSKFLALLRIASEAEASSGAYGFYAKAGIAYDYEYTANSARTQTSVGSSISATNDIVFNAQNMAQNGSAVTSQGGDITYNIAERLAFNTGVSITTTEEEEKKEHQELYVGTTFDTLFENAKDLSNNANMLPDFIAQYIKPALEYVEREYPTGTAVAAFGSVAYGSDSSYSKETITDTSYKASSVNAANGTVTVNVGGDFYHENFDTSNVVKNIEGNEIAKQLDNTHKEEEKRH